MLLNFFPLTFNSVFNPDPIQVGLKGLTTSLTLTVGTMTGSALLSFFKDHNREILLFATVIMSEPPPALASNFSDGYL